MMNIAGGIATSCVISQRIYGVMRQYTNPSVTTWPASMAVTAAFLFWQWRQRRLATIAAYAPLTSGLKGRQMGESFD